MIYFDYASTTPLRKEVLDTYMKLLATQFANSDSLHDMGRASAKLMEQSRANVAQLLHVASDEIIFTSCASESNNYAFKGYAWHYQNRGKHIITTCVEHSSIAHTCEQLHDIFGFEITYLPVYEDGCIRLEDLKKALRDDTILVSVMMVNNETGAINPIKECARYVHEHSRAAFHMDGVQALGKINIDLSDIDMATFSAHKIYGLKGSAILYKKRNIQLVPLISAGQQEQGLRGGTSNVATNIVFAKTLRLILEEQAANFNYVKRLNQKMRQSFVENEFIDINSDINASPYILNISAKNVGSEVMLNALNERGFAVSAKSTCSSKSNITSPVLIKMGFSEQRAKNAIRISLSHLTKEEDVEALLKNIKEICQIYGTK